MKLPQWTNSTLNADGSVDTTSTSVRYGPVTDGCNAIIIRALTLWSGGKIVKSKYTEATSDTPSYAHSGTSLGLSLHICSSYNADFDGDEVILVMVTTPEAELECIFIIRSSQKTFPYNATYFDNISGALQRDL